MPWSFPWLHSLPTHSYPAASFSSGWFDPKGPHPHLPDLNKPLHCRLEGRCRPHPIRKTLSLTGHSQRLPEIIPNAPLGGITPRLVASCTNLFFIVNTPRSSAHGADLILSSEGPIVSPTKRTSSAATMSRFITTSATVSVAPFSPHWFPTVWKSATSVPFDPTRICINF